MLQRPFYLWLIQLICQELWRKLPAIEGLTAHQGERYRGCHGKQAD
jgi:hypothetical protein